MGIGICEVPVAAVFGVDAAVVVTGGGKESG